MIQNWLDADHLSSEFGYVDEDLGVLKSGKEATVSLVERTLLGDGSTVLLAKKIYRFDRRFTRRDAYLQGSFAHRADLPQAYRQAGRSAHSTEWRKNEFEVLTALWQNGAKVPYPFEFGECGEVYMQFLGDGRVAAPRLESLAPAPRKRLDGGAVCSTTFTVWCISWLSTAICRPTTC